MSKPSPNLIELDCLRGIAILLVFFHHADGLLTPGIAGGGLQMSALRALVGGGHTGVSLFFVLSAFCLTLPIFLGGAERFQTREFFRRRALRILPAYWTAVLAGSFLTIPAASALVVAAPYMVFANSFHGHFQNIPWFSGVWWSLATEVQFYLLLPLLPYALRMQRGVAAGFVLVAVYLLAYGCYAAGLLGFGSWEIAVSLSHSVFGRGPVFLCGIFAAWLYARHGTSIREWMQNRSALRHGGSDVVLVLILAALGSLLGRVTLVGYYKAELAPLFTWHIVEGALWTAFVLLALLSPLRIKRVFTSAALARIGILSYSIYLVHVTVLGWTIMPMRKSFSPRFQSWDVETFFLVLFAGALTLALSSLTYRFIERPFLRIKDRSKEPTARTGELERALA